MLDLATRTQDEIVERIEARKDRDVMGFEVSEYVDYLDFDHAILFLTDEATPEKWDEVRGKVVSPKDAMKEYMSFAFDKAHGQRGISAGRSLSHMVAWAWLSGDAELSAYVEAEADTYSDYGLPTLRGICERLGIDPKEHGDS